MPIEGPMMKKLVLSIVAVVAVVFGFGAVANANAYPPGGANVTASPSTVGPGGQITVTANCTPGESVTISLEGSSVTVRCETGTSQPAVAGIATGIVTAPTVAGTFSGTVTGSVSGPLGTFTVTVQASAPATSTGGLPATGSDGTSTITFVAAGLLIVGLGLFAVATIRRRQTAAA